MRLRQLFEAAPARKIIAVMPGGFHPFHPGHKSLYDWAVETFGKDNVYVAATNDTTTRPFPFDVKIKLAQMAGVPANRFIQVISPFNALSYKNIIGDETQTALVFVRSEKDKTSHPLPDQIRKSDGNMGYLISYKGNDNLETADTHGYLAYGPTIDFDFSGMSIKSASELRAAWPEMSEEDKLKAAELMYPGNGQTATQLLDQALGIKDLEPAESISEQETRGTTLPQKIDVVKMPTPPQAPTANTPDGTDDNGVRISTTPKGNRSVVTGGGTYIFTPQGNLMLYMSPKIGGLQQTHNIAKKTVTVNFGTSAQGATIDQKATYDMQGNLISDDNLSMNRGDLTVGLGKDNGLSMNYRVNNNTTVSANTRSGISVNRNNPES